MSTGKRALKRCHSTSLSGKPTEFRWYCAEKLHQIINILQLLTLSVNNGNPHSGVCSSRSLVRYPDSFESENSGGGKIVQIPASGDRRWDSVSGNNQTELFFSVREEAAQATEALIARGESDLA